MALRSFYGIGNLPDGDMIQVSSEDQVHKLDGYKLANLFFTSNMKSQEEVQSVIDFLTIAKQGFVK